jgi:hypothetical protein
VKGSIPSTNFVILFVSDRNVGTQPGCRAVMSCCFDAKFQARLHEQGYDVEQQF